MTDRTIYHAVAWTLLAVVTAFVVWSFIVAADNCDGSLVQGVFGWVCVEER